MLSENKENHFDVALWFEWKNHADSCIHVSFKTLFVHSKAICGIQYILFHFFIITMITQVPASSEEKHKKNWYESPLEECIWFPLKW